MIRDGGSRLVGTRRTNVRVASIVSLCGVLFLVGGITATERASAAAGDITQKPGAAGCYSPTQNCMPLSPLENPANVEISPDGKHAYVTHSNAINVLDRKADGTLEQKPRPAGCLVADFTPDPAGCATASNLSNVRGLALSEDGRNLYVASDYSVAVFDIAGDGSIAQITGPAGCISTQPGCTPGTGMSGGFGGGHLTVAPDDSQVLRADPFDHALAIFARSEDGSLSQGVGGLGCFRAVGTPACAAGSALEGAGGLAVSPDGRSVYIASFDSNAIAIFDRDPSGVLSQKPASAGCLSVGGAGGCTAARGIEGARDVTISADGETVYASGRHSNAVAIFDRSPNGVLSQRSGTAGCVAAGGADGCAPGRALEAAWSVAIAPDQSSLYVSSASGGSIATFDRTIDGAISQKAGSAGCVNATGQDGCAVGHAIDTIIDLEVSPDGLSLYAVNYTGSLLVFDREPPMPTPPDPQDTVVPILAGLKLSPVRFKAAKKGPSVASAGKSRVTFRLSENAAVRFTVERAAVGRRAGKRCAKPTRANRTKRRCLRFVRQRGSFTRAGAAGANSFRFTGRLGGRTLKPGRHRLIAVATDAVGNRSKPARSGFRILRRR